LHHPASGTLLLYKQRRSSVLSLGSHSSTRVTSKHGQPTCLHQWVYGEVNDDTWRRAPLVDQHGDRQHWWTSHGTVIRGMARWPASLVDCCTAWSPAQHEDSQHKWMAQPPQLDVITVGLVDVCRAAWDSARYSFWHGNILHGTSHRARLWHWPLHRTIPVVPHW